MVCFVTAMEDDSWCVYDSDAVQMSSWVYVGASIDAFYIFHTHMFTHVDILAEVGRRRSFVFVADLVTFISC